MVNEKLNGTIFTGSIGTFVNSIVAIEQENEIGETNIRELNLINFNMLYDLFYKELSNNEDKYKVFLKNKLMLFKNNLKFNYFSKYRNLRNEVKDKKQLIEAIDKDLEVINKNKKSWIDIVYDIKPLLYIFIDVMKDFSCFNEMKMIIDSIYNLNSKLIVYFIKKNRKILKYFDINEIKNILSLGLRESIYKYDPFMQKKKGNFEYKEVLFSGVAYNYMKKCLTEEIIERIHIASLSSEEKLKYIEYYKRLLVEKDNDEKKEEWEEGVEINFFNNYIYLDEYIDDDCKTERISLLKDERDEYTNIENKIVINKLLNYLAPEEIYAIYYMKNNMTHDEDVMNLLGLNVVKVTANQIRYPVMAKRAMEKIKGLI